MSLPRLSIEHRLPTTGMTTSDNDPNTTATSPANGNATPPQPCNTTPTPANSPTYLTGGKTPANPNRPIRPGSGTGGPNATDPHSASEAALIVAAVGFFRGILTGIGSSPLSYPRTQEAAASPSTTERRIQRAHDPKRADEYSPDG